MKEFFQGINNELQIIGPMDFDYQFVKKEVPTIIVDGGLNHKLKFFKRVVVGDGDSCLASNSQFIDHRLNSDKDFSDFSYAMDKIKELKLKSIRVFGFLGGRRDHEFFNFLEVYSFLENKENLQVNFENNVLLFSSGEYQLNHIGLFSLSTLINNNIELEGKVKYIFKGNLKKFKTTGLSNEASGDFLLKVSQPIILFKE